MPASRFFCTLSLLACLAAGCAPARYDPALASTSYPRDLHGPDRLADMQVFHDDTSIEIVNSTVNSYQNCLVWLNQRYVRAVDSLPAGETIQVSLWEFRDERGEVFNAGGFFRTRPPTPVRLVEIQPGDGQPLIGLIAIPAVQREIRAEVGR